MRPLVLVSGGFDPLHSGHIKYLEAAAELGEVCVLLNSDEWLTRKKGKPFMNWEERKTILQAMKSVYVVSFTDDSDGTVCHSLEMYAESRDKFLEDMGQHREIIFANGGDRTDTTTPEVVLCKKLGITLTWIVGGEKSQSSSTLLKDWEKK